MCVCLFVCESMSLAKVALRRIDWMYCRHVIGRYSNILPVSWRSFSRPSVVYHFIAAEVHEMTPVICVMS
jgi:hypothetical protein